MARGRVLEAKDAVVETAVAWYTATRDNGGGPQPALANRFADAVEEYVRAVQAQDVSDVEVYERTDAHSTEIAARQAAMLSRPSWRQVIYRYLTTYGSHADAELERIFNRQWSTLRGRVAIGSDQIAVSTPKHQTVSSARKSLLDCGLVAKDEIVIIDGRPHIRWRAVPQQTGTP